MRLIGRYSELEDYTTDREGLKAFIKTLSDEHGDAIQWIERIGAFLEQVPTERWNDDAIYNVSYKLADFSKHLTDLEQLCVFHEQEKCSQDPESEATLLRSVRKGKNELHIIVYVDKDIKQSIKTKITQIKSLLAQHSKEQHKAIVAELVNDLLDIEETKK